MQKASKQLGREKVNFMLDRALFLEIKTYVPEGERSDFANEAFEEALRDFKRKKALEGLDELRAMNKTYISNKELIQLRDEGRE